ncbi:MAG: hypothetical protein IJ649_09050, partial [Oscillospiraceae bacterium]|nr:hypothetical protein [Oscillospiraceae bacterium]
QKEFQALGKADFILGDQYAHVGTSFLFDNVILQSGLETNLKSTNACGNVARFKLVLGCPVKLWQKEMIQVNYIFWLKRKRLETAVGEALCVRSLSAPCSRDDKIMN